MSRHRFRWLLLPLAASIVMGLVLVTAQAQVGAPAPDDLHDRLEAARSDLQRIQSQAETVSDQIASIDAQIAAVTAALDASSALVERTRREVAVLQSRVDSKERLQTRLERRSTRLAVDLYKAGPIAGVETLLKAKDFGELGSRLEYLGTAARTSLNTMTAAERVRVELEAEKAVLTAKLAEVRALRAEQISEAQHLADLRSAQDTKLADLRERIAAERVEAEALLARSDEIMAELAPVGASAPSVQPAVGAAGFAWPLQGAVTSGYGPRWGRMHQGIDVDCVTGAPIRASKGGRVVTATFDDGYGNHLVIDHGGGFASLYAHNSQLFVGAGETVEQGQTIASCGATGAVTGDHLHFEIRVNGSPQDPLAYLP